MGSARQFISLLRKRPLWIAWLAASIAAVVPVYYGEVTPGSAMTVLGFQLLLVTFAMGFADLLFFFAATLPISLFLLTPLALVSRLENCATLRRIWGLLLILSSASPIVMVLQPLSGGNRWLFGAYELPIPLLIAGVALWVHAPKHPAGHCRRCGYDLRATAGATCPECGEATVSPAVDAT